MDRKAPRTKGSITNTGSAQAGRPSITERMITMMNHENGSAKLRASERIAAACGFDYNITKHPYGGYFTGRECEEIAAKIEHLERELALLKEEARTAQATIGAAKTHIAILNAEVNRMKQRPSTP